MYKIDDISSGGGGSGSSTSNSNSVNIHFVMPVALLTIHIEFECLKELDLFTFEVCNMSSLSSNCSIFMILNGNHIGFWQTNLE